MIRRTLTRIAPVVLAVVAVSCTSGPLMLSGSPSPSATASATRSSSPGPTLAPPASPLPTGPGSAAAERALLCRIPPIQKASAAPPGHTPAAIRQIEHEVEQVRGLTYKRPVSIDAISHDELARRLDRSFSRSFPNQLYARRSMAWQTIGVIPRGTSIRRALASFLGSQVIGFYDPDRKELVFQGTASPTAIERVTLAHELTHAIDDQYFDLTRLDGLQNRCADEAQEAAIGAVEGSAQFFSGRVAAQFLTLSDITGAAFSSAGPPPKGVPPFIEEIELWPYVGGLKFITARFDHGGLEAVNQALKHFPVSTEQVIHPEKYPADMPYPVDIPELAPKLGHGWRALDVMDVGEEWLKAMLDRVVDDTAATEAAAGWGGGLYRAWANGKRVVVVMSTVWDTQADAGQFAATLQQALSNRPIEVRQRGFWVDVLFASDQSTLSAESSRLRELRG